MRILLPVFFTMILFGCKNNKEPQQDKQTSTAKTDTLPYYNVAEQIQQEVAAVTSNKKMFIYKITEEKGKKDSVVIDTTQFNQLAAPFYEIQLNKPEIKSQYKESVFADNETKSYVLDYKTDNPKLSIKSISVLLDNEKQDFKRADYQKIYQHNDTLFEERLAWTAGKKFQVIQIATVGSTELTKQTYVYWRQRK